MWIRKLLQKHDLKTVSITISKHCASSMIKRDIDFKKIEETIRTGKFFREKCRWPKKLCFARYFGKENQTYFVVAAIKQKSIEVVTTWEKKGR